MNAIGIICEYNPFHLGHARMLEGLRRQYDAPLVCAMSGNFVQRGDAAVAHKHARGEMAVRCGADLVLELPTPWAMASAERFAAGGVALLTSTGVVSHLAFGSECGDLTALQAAEAALSRPELMPRIRQLLAQGMAYAPARQQAAEELGAPPRMLSRPNDILAIEYLKALRRQKAPMEPLAVQRQGDGHDGAPSGDTASASYLRTLLRSGRTDEALSYLPAPAAQVLRRELALGQAPADLSYCQRAILARLRQLREEDFLPYDGGKEGLYDAARTVIFENLGSIVRPMTRRLEEALAAETDAAALCGMLQAEITAILTAAPPVLVPAAAAFAACGRRKNARAAFGPVPAPAGRHRPHPGKGRSCRRRQRPESLPAGGYGVQHPA